MQHNFIYLLVELLKSKDNWNLVFEMYNYWQK